MAQNNGGNNSDNNATGDTTAGADPLMEQMRSILQLGPRASDPSQSRGRRFSDADRPNPQLSLSRPEPVAVWSRDGTRLLPAPDEQSHSSNTGFASFSTLAQRPEAFGSVEQHTCAATPCAVKTVFETTELLELVLSFLETKDILSSRLTGRKWAVIIHESPLLRLHFFTFGQWSRPGAQFQLLPLRLPGLRFELGE